MGRHLGAGARAGLPAADRYAPRARRRGRGHDARLRADAGASRTAPHRCRGDRSARWAVAGREGVCARVAAPRAQALREGPRLRPRPGARLPRADDHGAPAGHPERDDARLRVRDAPAPSRRPRGDEGRRPRCDPGGAHGPLRRAPTEAPPVSGAQGGVLPVRLRARPDRPRRAARQPGSERSSSSALRRTSRSTTGARTRSSRACWPTWDGRATCMPSSCLAAPSSGTTCAA